MGGLAGFGIMMAQWILAIIGLIWLSNRVKDKVVDPDFDLDSTIDDDIDREESPYGHTAVHAIVEQTEEEVTV